MYRPLSEDTLDDFHGLVRDGHVRRYLLDGERFPRDWSAARVTESLDLFHRRGVGLWLTSSKAADEVVGFCGFLELPGSHPGPQLVYALFERFTGLGYATEMAHASIDEARRHPGFETIVACVDLVNGASLRVLKKLGFQVVSTSSGRAGDVLTLELPPALPAR